MRRYSSFFVQAWIEDGADKAGVCRLKVEHVQTGAVVVLTDLQELAQWLEQSIGSPQVAPPVAIAERPE